MLGRINVLMIKSLDFNDISAQVYTTQQRLQQCNTSQQLPLATRIADTYFNTQTCTSAHKDGLGAKPSTQSPYRRRAANWGEGGRGMALATVVTRLLSPYDITITTAAIAAAAAAAAATAHTYMLCMTSMHNNEISSKTSSFHNVVRPRFVFCGRKSKQRIFHIK